MACAGAHAHGDANQGSGSLAEYVEGKHVSSSQAIVTEHFGLAPSNAGYRFGNHPLTRGPVRREPRSCDRTGHVAKSPWSLHLVHCLDRGPDVPFQAGFPDDMLYPLILLSTRSVLTSIEPLFDHI